MEISEFGIKRSTKIVIVAVMATVIIAEIVACLCMGSVKPAESLVIDYEAAKESMTDMEKELRITERARQENAEAVNALTLLMTGRPAEVGFETLAVHAEGEDNSWASVAVRAKTEEALQRYISNLAASGGFGGVVIASSERSQDGSISAVLRVQKREAR